MKRLSIASLMVLLFVATGCTKEKSDNEPVAKQKILGKWKFDRIIYETWQPNGSMIDTETEYGEPGDSAIFKNNNIAYAYEDRNGVPEEDIIPYEFLNDSTIIIDDEIRVIRKLSDTELYLYQEELDNTHHVVDVEKMYLVR